MGKITIANDMQMVLGKNLSKWLTEEILFDADFIFEYLDQKINRSGFRDSMMTEALVHQMLRIGKLNEVMSLGFARYKNKFVSHYLFDTIIQMQCTLVENVEALRVLIKDLSKLVLRFKDLDNYFYGIEKNIKNTLANSKDEPEIRQKCELKFQIRIERDKLFQYFRKNGKIDKIFKNSKNKPICNIDKILQGESIQEDSGYSFEKPKKNPKKEKNQYSKDLFYSSFNAKPFHDKRLFFFLCMAGLKMIKKYLKYTISDQMKDFLIGVYQNFLKTKRSHAKVLWKVSWVFIHGFLKDFFEKQKPFNPLYSSNFRTSEIFGEMFDSMTNIMRFLLEADSQKTNRFFRKWLKMNVNRNQQAQRPVFRNFVVDSFILEDILKFCLIEDDRRSSQDQKNFREAGVPVEKKEKTSIFSEEYVATLDVKEIQSKSSIQSLNSNKTLNSKKNLNSLPKDSNLVRRRSSRTKRKHHYSEIFFQKMKIIHDKKEEIEHALEILETENEKNRERGSHNYFFYFTFPDDFELMGLHSKKTCPPEFEKRLLKFLENRHDQTRSKLNFWGISMGDTALESLDSSFRGSRNRSFHSSGVSSRRISKNCPKPHISDFLPANVNLGEIGSGLNSKSEIISKKGSNKNFLRGYEDSSVRRFSGRPNRNSLTTLEPIPEGREIEEGNLNENQMSRKIESKMKIGSIEDQILKKNIKYLTPQKKESQGKIFTFEEHKKSIQKSENSNQKNLHDQKSEASNTPGEKTRWTQKNKMIEDTDEKTEPDSGLRTFSPQEMKKRFNLSPFSVGKVEAPRPIQDFLSKENREQKYIDCLNFVQMFMSSLRLRKIQLRNKKTINMLILIDHMAKHKEGFRGMFKKAGDDFVFNKLCQDLHNRNELHFDLLQIFSFLKVVVFRRKETMRVGNESLFLYQTTVENLLTARMSRLDQLIKIYERNLLACRILFKLKLTRVQMKYKDIDMESYKRLGSF